MVEVQHRKTLVMKSVVTDFELELRLVTMETKTITGVAKLIDEGSYLAGGAREEPRLAKTRARRSARTVSWSAQKRATTETQTSTTGAIAAASWKQAGIDSKTKA